MPLNSAKIANLKELFPLTFRTGVLSLASVSTPPELESVLLPKRTAVPNELLTVSEPTVGLAPSKLTSQLAAVGLLNMTMVPLPVGPPKGASGIQLVVFVQLPLVEPFQVKVDCADADRLATMRAQSVKTIEREDAFFIFLFGLGCSFWSCEGLTNTIY